MATPSNHAHLIPPLRIGKYTFSSRLILGTGKYATFPIMREALEASGADLITVAVRRVKLPGSGGEGESLLDYIDKSRYTLLPNTAGCFNAEDAVRTALLGREAGFSDLVKLEVLADPKTLLPEPLGTLDAATTLVKEGFTVMVYTTDDPVLAIKLANIGVHAVMPAGSPIGSGQGVLNPNNITIMLEMVAATGTGVPVIVDAGVGTASDVVQAMELGVEGVLLNTGVAMAADPVAMAHAMRMACESGYLAARAGRIPKRLYANASSPTTGTIGAIPGE
jgi:thiazole synthase